MKHNWDECRELTTSRDFEDDFILSSIAGSQQTGLMSNIFFVVAMLMSKNDRCDAALRAVCRKTTSFQAARKRKLVQQSNPQQTIRV